MAPRIRRTTLPALLVAVAIAGCGGSSTLSTGQYESQGVAALNPVLTALNSLRTNPTSVSGWQSVQSASQHASSAFAKLKPPSKISSLNSQLAASLGDMGSAAGRLGTDISKRDGTAARADLSSYSSALRRYGSVINQLGSKGVKFLGS